MPLSDYMEQSFLNQVFRGGTPLQPASVYIALLTAAPSDSSTGSTITEPSTGGYTRKAVVTSPTGSSRFSAPGTGGLTDNLDAIQWTNSAATTWAVTHCAIVDASSGGNILWYGALTTSKSVGQNDTFQFAAGDLDLSLD